MSNTAIKVENLSKRYRIGLKEKIHDTMVGAITDFVKRPIKNLKLLRNLSTFSDNGHESDDTIWALKDVSFEINHGEVVGIIGKNGAGKSTLLKIISRITAPTSGSVIFNGRVSSLLEVGTGFHPELTGRENVYLNGTILGMSKSEIDRKFDEIVAFSEVEKFLDTPVKRYSSGMRVRLAFSIAAHLEPEILLVDEVLAVGDSEFQKKCLGKMGSVAKEGRTILFVSHNMGAIQRLCDRSLLLFSNCLAMDAATEQVIAFYLNERGQEDKSSCKIEYEHGSAPGDQFVRLRCVQLTTANGHLKPSFCMNEAFAIKITFEVLKRSSSFHLYVRVYTEDGILAFASADWDKNGISAVDRQPGKYQMIVSIPSHLLNRGTYMLSVSGLIPDVRFVFQESSVLTWRILPQGGVGGFQSISRLGVFRPLLEWNEERI